jgi:hypothetical protein
MIEKQPFVKYNVEDDKKKVDVFSVKLNPEQRSLLEECKYLIEQPKDSTALKTLAWIGAKVILADPTAYIIKSLFKNKKNNERLGIPDFD